MTRHDLTTEADVQALVEAFYADLDPEPVLGRYFPGLDWDAHLPRMVASWFGVAFQTGGYRGQPFAPHARMPGLGREHFARWVERFSAAVDARFAGPSPSASRRAPSRWRASSRSSSACGPSPPPTSIRTDCARRRGS